jgi:hypothetical protein
MSKVQKIDFTDWIVNNNDSSLKTIYYELQIVKNYLPGLQNFIISISNYFEEIFTNLEDISVIVPNIGSDKTKIEKYKHEALKGFRLLLKTYDEIQNTTYNATIIFLLNEQISKYNNRLLEQNKYETNFRIGFTAKDELYFENIIICFEYCLYSIELTYFENKNCLPFKINYDLIENNISLFKVDDTTNPMPLKNKSIAIPIEQIIWKNDLKELAYLFWKLREQKIIDIDNLGLTLSKCFTDSNKQEVKNTMFNKYFSEFNQNNFPKKTIEIDAFIKAIKNNTIQNNTK